MLRRTGILNFYLRRPPCRCREVSTLTRRPKQFRRGVVITILGVAVGSTAAWYKTSSIYNEIAAPSKSLKAQKNRNSSNALTPENSHPDTLHSLIWGSNSAGILLPGTPGGESIRKPTNAEWLEGVAVRDLRLHERHAACVDARGDVYQWGDGFFGNSSSDARTRLPKRTLRGKNIVQLQLTDDKVYALSASGRLYVLASNAEQQRLLPGVSTPSSDSLWGTGLFSREEQTVDFAEVVPAENLRWGESFASIVAGKNHLLALTSKGRVFAHPVNKQANHYGQLGFCKFNISGPSSGKSSPTLEIELIPKSVADPYINASRAARTTSTPFTSDNLAEVDDKNIRFCTTLFEVPILRGVEAEQIAAGSRSSFMRTKTGRVLAWGANDFGQLGLGGHVPLETITVPTEVVLWRFVPSTTGSKCLDVTAGGDLTTFLVERKREDNPSVTTDLLMAGNGQYGGLGNNSYLNSQGEPTRIRGISGLMQYNDKTKCLESIKPSTASISPTGHVIVSLSSASSSGVGGNDLMVWGRNYDSELGNGKRASVAQPVAVEATERGERLMLFQKKVKEVKDLQGKILQRGVRVEQKAIAGPQKTVVYWKIDV